MRASSKADGPAWVDCVSYNIQIQNESSPGTDCELKIHFKVWAKGGKQYDFITYNDEPVGRARMTKILTVLNSPWPSTVFHVQVDQFDRITDIKK